MDISAQRDRRAPDIDTPGAGQGNATCAECHFRTHGTALADGRPEPEKGLVNFAPNVQPLNGALERDRRTAGAPGHVHADVPRAGRTNGFQSTRASPDALRVRPGGGPAPRQTALYPPIHGAGAESPPSGPAGSRPKCAARRMGRRGASSDNSLRCQAATPAASEMREHDASHPCAWRKSRASPGRPRMTAPRPPATGQAAVEMELLAQLGLPASASPEDVDSLHQAVSEFLSAAPPEIRGWARAQVASLDSAYIQLTDPVGLGGSALSEPGESADGRTRRAGDTSGPPGPHPGGDPARARGHLGGRRRRGRGARHRG